MSLWTIFQLLAQVWQLYLIFRVQTNIKRKKKKEKRKKEDKEDLCFCSNQKCFTILNIA